MSLKTGVFIGCFLLAILLIQRSTGMCPVPKDDHAIYHTDRTEHDVGDKITMSCKEGYKLVSHGRGMQCRPRYTCKQPVLPHTSFEPNKAEYNHDDVINVSCSNKFIRKNPASGRAYCAPNGKLKNVGTCVANFTCAKPNIMDAIFYPSNQTFFKYEDVIYMTCTGGLSLIDNSTIKCHPNGSLTGVGKCVCTSYVGIKEIPDGALNASSFYRHPQHTIQSAKFGTKNFWCAENLAGEAEEWFEVKFEKPTSVSGVIIDDSSSGNHCITRFHIKYIDQNDFWKTVNENNIAKSFALIAADKEVCPNEVITRYFPGKIMTKRIRIVVDAANNRACMRLELIGC